MNRSTVIPEVKAPVFSPSLSLSLAQSGRCVCSQGARREDMEDGEHRRQRQSTSESCVRLRAQTLTASGQHSGKSSLTVPEANGLGVRCGIWFQGSRRAVSPLFPQLLTQILARESSIQVVRLVK